MSTTKSGIEWTDRTWNPVRGCFPVSPGCASCYAAKMASRFSGPGQPYEGLAMGGKWTGKVRCIESALDEPRRWRKPARIFVNSMSDLFHEDVPSRFIAHVFGAMEEASRHTFMVLTKRPERMEDFCRRYVSNPLPNVWLGVSVENQQAADERVPLLCETPAFVRFLSCEPLLGPVRVGGYLGYAESNGGDPFFGIDWVIAGGESGPNARPMHPDWARSLRDQCAEAGVPFFFKQMSRKAPIPDDLMIREFPHANS